MTTFDPATVTTDSVQLELSLAPLTQPDYTPRMPLPERFALFHAANPHVADALEQLAEEYLQHNDHAAIAMFYEVLRYQSGVQTTGSAYKLDNSFRAFYSRLLVERRPEWSDVFEFREQKAAA